MLILSSVLSGIAADLWPGKHKDRARFVQLWSGYAEPSLKPNLISVPLLLEHLYEEGKDLARKLAATHPQAFPPYRWPATLVITGEDVDKPEEDLLALDPRLTAKVVRPFSYGSLFYEHVHSGFVHEFHTTDSASVYRMAAEPTPVSYVNMSLRKNMIKTYRRIHFDFCWLIEIVESISAAVKPLIDHNRLPRPEPNPWWVHG